MLHVYVRADTWWIGIQVLDGWVCLQPFPCLGVAWRRSV